MNIFSNFFDKKRPTNRSELNINDNDDRTDLILIKEFKDEIKEIDIENQPFCLSGLLHVVTNKISALLKQQKHTILYDIDREVGRYIVGDSYYIEYVLSTLLSEAILLNEHSEIILKISKFENKFLMFDVSNHKAVLDKEVYDKYNNASQIISTQNEKLNIFVKAKKFTKAMHGSIEIDSSRALGTHYICKIPYFEDKQNKTYQDELKNILANKNALFIARDIYDIQRTAYIFETYGIHIHHMNLEEFEKKKPDFRVYDMMIIRSADISYKHIAFFKNILKNDNDFKIIIIHELFENIEKIKLTKSIASAELYAPMIIGDVEEILRQIFILKSKAVKGINNIEIFDLNKFLISGNDIPKEENLEYYQGANIAIVEDSKVDEKILQNILKHEGITLYCMRNGDEMLSLLDREEIDIIFSDIHMPVMDGIAMTKKIRAEKKWNAIPIISISSMAFPDEFKAMELAGMNAAITKPIQKYDVHSALRKFLIMTDKIRHREKNSRQVYFLYNKEILDVSVGIYAHVDNEEYLENLLKTMDYLRKTRNKFDDLIYSQNFIELDIYVGHALELYENIHATQMIRMFKNLKYTISQRQKIYLLDYIAKYRKYWEELEEEVEKYVQSS